MIYICTNKHPRSSQEVAVLEQFERFEVVFLGLGVERLEEVFGLLHGLARLLQVVVVRDLHAHLIFYILANAKI